MIILGPEPQFGNHCSIVRMEVTEFMVRLMSSRWGSSDELQTPDTCASFYLYVQIHVFTLLPGVTAPTNHIAAFIAPSAALGPSLLGMFMNVVQAADYINTVWSMHALQCPIPLTATKGHKPSKFHYLVLLESPYELSLGSSSFWQFHKLVTKINSIQNK